MAHKITMNERESLFVTGVMDVISFDDETIIAETEKGTLVLRGTGLHVIKLSVENGDLEIGGYMYSINYEDSNYMKEKSLFGKIFK